MVRIEVTIKEYTPADIWAHATRNLTNPAVAQDLPNMQVGISPTGTGREALLDILNSDSRYILSNPYPTPVDGSLIDVLLVDRLTAERAAALDKILPPYTTKEIRIYPSAAGGVEAYSGTAVWAWGSWVELVPANTITSDFLILGVVYDQYYALSESVRWQVQLGVGAAGAEAPIASVAGTHYYYSASGWGDFPFYPLVIPRKVPANSRVAVRATDDDPTAFRHCVKIQYVELPL